MINNAIILIATLVVLLGTSILLSLMPLVSVRSVGPPYFNALFVPLTWLLLIAMGMGSNIRWKKISVRYWVGIAIAASSSYWLLLSPTLPVHRYINISVTLAGSFWVLLWMIVDFRDKTKNAPNFLKVCVSCVLAIK